MNLNIHQVIFHLIHPEYNSPDTENPERSLLQRLVTLILEDYFRKEDPRMDDLVEYIQQNLHDPLPLGELCKKMSMGESYLRSHFKYKTGMSLRNFILTLKMATAMDMILHSRMSITMIAVEVGYDSLISFEKMFAKRYGHPPTYFRANRDDENQKV